VRLARTLVPLLVAGSAALAQNPAAPAAGSVYQPGIDVLDYDFTIVLPDTGAFLRADVTVTARRNVGVSSLKLDLVAGLTVRTVEVNGRRVPPRHAHGKLDVPLSGVAGDSVSVRVTYDGIVTDGLIARQDPRGRWTWFGDNWPDRARHWLATVDHPSDKATVTWTVRAPTGRTVVANGALLGVRPLTGHDQGRSDTRWRESHPIPTDIMVIGAGPLARFDIPATRCGYADPSQCVPQTVYAMPENRDWLPGPFNAAPAIVGLFERLVGPFPYEKLAHVQSATRFGGMENASAIFYAWNLFTTHTLGEGTIAHEIAHQWFGDAVTEREWGHLWLSEGFATYFDPLWTKHSRGEAAFRAQMATIRQKVLGDSIVEKRPVLDTTETDYLKLLNANSYEKGGYVLFMLNRQLGDSAFFGGLRSYYSTYRDGNATTDDLRRELERSSGRSLGRFFDQWLRRPGVAEPALGWSYDVTEQTVSVVAIQDSPRGPYELPLTVLVTEPSEGGQQRRVEVTLPAEQRATIVLPGRYAARPAALIFDPDAVLLARIRRL
jgi:aminopeptidase N